MQSGARTVIRNAKGIPYVGTAAAAIEAGMTGLNIMYDRNQIDKDIAAGKISQEDGERLKAQITLKKEQMRQLIWQQLVQGQRLVEQLARH